MNRRNLLRLASALSVVPLVGLPVRGRAAAAVAATARRRCLPGDPDWPTEGAWSRLNDAVSGRLVKLRSPMAACADPANGDACAQLFKELKNPYFIGDNPALTQTCGWVDAWTSRPSAYVVRREQHAGRRRTR